MEVDYLIVGQGIAGTVLADHFMESGCRVLVFDEASLSNSSKVAGGLYNPVTGRKMVKTWWADKFFPYMLSYYRGLEQRLGASFLNEMPIYRPFLSVEEQNEWMAKSADALYQPFIKEVADSSKYGRHIRDEHGGLLLAQSGYVNTAELLRAFRGYLLQRGALIAQFFDASRLELTASGVNYQGHKAKAIIFSEGTLVAGNPFFRWLPLRPVKGELLFIKVRERFSTIYNRGVFIIPLSDGTCKVGATYDHQNLDSEPTEEAKWQLMHRLDELIRLPYEVVGQVAGLRPATKDRRPFLGRHPDCEQVAIFGGLGTKGVSLSPFLARQLVNDMTGGAELPEEVNIGRFFRYI